MHQILGKAFSKIENSVNNNQFKGYVSKKRENLNTF